jgi:hypothetical protein
MPEPQTTTKTSSPVLIAAAWLIVLIPTAWGLNYTVRNAVKIFDRAPAATTTTPPK